MKLVAFSRGGAERRLGGLCPDGDFLVDLSEAGIAADLRSLVEAGAPVWRMAAQAIDAKDKPVKLADVRLLAPFDNPRRNIFCVGKNYVEHASEFQGSGFDGANASGQDVPDHPIIFTKAASTISGPGDPIPASGDPMSSTDYEGELTILIGKAGRNIGRESAYDHVFGYTIVNDVTSRGLQKKHNQWFLGKNLDGFCPMGPSVVTSDDILDIAALELTTHVNGELRQSARVSQLIFDIPKLIETISSVLTLEPGDLIATGTPAGVGIGFSPPRFLKAGDRVEITIEPIGTLSNPVI